MNRLLVLVILVVSASCVKRRSSTDEIYIHAFSKQGSNQEFLTLKNNGEFSLQKNGHSPQGGYYRIFADTVYLEYSDNGLVGVLPDTFCLTPNRDSLKAVDRGHYFKLGLAEEVPFRGL